MKLGWLLALFVLGGCAPRVVVVAETRDAGSERVDASISRDAARSCASHRDCEGGDFCEKASCAAPQGTCVSRPTRCNDDPAPTCGCDGVTYFNACLLHQRGQNALAEGPCTAHVERCDDQAGDFCPGDGVCAHLVEQDACHADEVAGACWVLPPRCDGAGADRDALRARSCRDDRGCADLCAAVESGRRFVLTESCGAPGSRGRPDSPKGSSVGFP